MADFNFPNIYWKSYTANLPNKFLICIGDNFLLQKVEHIIKVSRILDFLVTNNEKLFENMKVTGMVGESYHCAIFLNNMHKVMAGFYQLPCYTPNPLPISRLY